MADPITTGALIASTLALGAEAALKGVVGEAVKDAYKKLKHEISRWAAADVDALEENPASAGRKAVVAEAVDRLATADQEALARSAEALAERLDAESGAAAVDIERLEAVRVRLRNITTHGVTGIRVGTAVLGTLDIEGLTAGPKPGKL